MRNFKTIALTQELLKNIFYPRAMYCSPEQLPLYVATDIIVRVNAIRKSTQFYLSGTDGIFADQVPIPYTDAVGILVSHEILSAFEVVLKDVAVFANGFIDVYVVDVPLKSAFKYDDDFTGDNRLIAGIISTNTVTGDISEIKTYARISAELTNITEHGLDTDIPPDVVSTNINISAVLTLANIEVKSGQLEPDSVVTQVVLSASITNITPLPIESYLETDIVVTSISLSAVLTNVTTGEIIAY
jgi:hypothetical protein